MGQIEIQYKIWQILTIKFRRVCVWIWSYSTLRNGWPCIQIVTLKMDTWASQCDKCFEKAKELNINCDYLGKKVVLQDTNIFLNSFLFLQRILLFKINYFCTYIGTKYPTTYLCREISRDNNFKCLTFTYSYKVSIIKV